MIIAKIDIIAVIKRQIKKINSYTEQETELSESLHDSWSLMQSLWWLCEKLLTQLTMDPSNQSVTIIYLYMFMCICINLYSGKKNMYRDIKLIYKKDNCSPNVWKRFNNRNYILSYLLEYFLRLRLQLDEKNKQHIFFTHNLSQFNRTSMNDNIVGREKNE